jgi:hypothetical protein
MAPVKEGWPDLFNTEKALEVFKKGIEGREKVFNLATTVETVREWESAVNKARHLVKRAFHEDTKHFNSYSACMATDIEHLTQLVVRWRT